MKAKILLIVLGLIGYTSILFAQDDDNPIALEEYIYYEDGKVTSKHKTIYTYDEDSKLIEEFYYSTSEENSPQTYSSTPTISKKYTYLPNSEKLHKIEVESSTTQTTSDYTYYDNGDLKTLELKSIYVSIYSNDTTYETTTWDYTYYDNGCLKKLIEQHGLTYSEDDYYNTSSRYTTYYNESCSDETDSFNINKDSVIIQRWGEKICGFPRLQKSIYEYEDLKHTILTYAFNDENEAYQLSNTYVKEFDDIGNIIYTSMSSSSHINEVFYIYDENNNLIQEDHYQNYGSIRELYFREISNYDEQGNLISFKQFILSDELNEMIPSIDYKSAYIYDDKGKPIERQSTNHNYDNTGLLYLTSHYTSVYDTYCNELDKENKYYRKRKHASEDEYQDQLTTVNYAYLKEITCETENIPPSPLTAYPNPATDYVTFNSDILLQENSTVNLHDVTGKLIWQGNTSQKRASYTLSTQNLHKGMYLVRIISGEDVLSQKFIKE